MAVYPVALSAATEPLEMPRGRRCIDCHYYQSVLVHEDWCNGFVDLCIQELAEDFDSGEVKWTEYDFEACEDFKLKQE